MKKNVIGSKIEHYAAVIASAVGAIALLLPFVTVADKNLNLLDIVAEIFKLLQNTSEISSVLSFVGVKQIPELANIEAALLPVAGLGVAVIVFAVISVVLGIVGVANSNGLSARIWVFVAAVQAVLVTILMLTFKGIMDQIAELLGNFLMDGFGIGFGVGCWLALISAYICLVLVIKMTFIALQKAYLNFVAKTIKPVIGLVTAYMPPALIASVVGAACIFLPYASVGGKSVTLLGLMGASWLTMAAVVLVALSAVLAIVNYVRPSVKGALVWVISAALQTAVLSVLLFASKSMLDGLGVLPQAFLVKNFGIGYWLSLVASYVALVLSMKLAKVNTGYIVLVILSVIWLFPILWIVLTALRAESGYYVGYFFPKSLTLNNFFELFKHPDVLPFGRWWVNTMIVAICGCLINTVIVLGVAFILSRTRFKGRKLFMNILMIIGMFPGFMSMLAVYNILKGLNMNHSIFALVIVGAASAAMGYHVCKGFFDTMPKALDEAATIDGATKWQIFTKITIPLSKPIAIYTLLTNFLGAWSDYIFPSMLFGDQQSNYTVAIGLKWMTDFRRIDTYYTQFAAGALIVAIPIVILFICLQKYYVEGLSGAVKG